MKKSSRMRKGQGRPSGRRRTKNIERPRPLARWKPIRSKADFEQRLDEALDPYELTKPLATSIEWELQRFLWGWPPQYRVLPWRARDEKTFVMLNPSLKAASRGVELARDLHATLTRAQKLLQEFDNWSNAQAQSDSSQEAILEQPQGSVDPLAIEQWWPRNVSEREAFTVAERAHRRELSRHGGEQLRVALDKLVKASEWTLGEFEYQHPVRARPRGHQPDRLPPC